MEVGERAISAVFQGKARSHMGTIAQRFDGSTASLSETNS
jgi:hypothetical protein